MPAHRVGSLEDMAGAAIYLASRAGDYVVGETMSASEAAAYHGLQARAFAEAGAEMMTAVTMTYVDEAIGAYVFGSRCTKS